jgi:ribosomal protein S18 acetylase RimI-like enzyme
MSGRIEIAHMGPEDLPGVARQFVDLHTMYDVDSYRRALLTDELVRSYLTDPGRPFAVYIARWYGQKPLPNSPSSNETSLESLEASEGAGNTPEAVPAAGYCVAGFVQVSIKPTLPFNDPPNTGEIDNLWVESWTRGRNIGSMLLNEAEQWLRRKSVYHVELYVYKYNTHAMGFYASNGYAAQHEVMRKELRGS